MLCQYFSKYSLKKKLILLSTISTILQLPLYYHTHTPFGDSEQFHHVRISFRHSFRQQAQLIRDTSPGRTLRKFSFDRLTYGRDGPMIRIPRCLWFVTILFRYFSMDWIESLTFLGYDGTSCLSIETGWVSMEIESIVEKFDSSSINRIDWNINNTEIENVIKWPRHSIQYGRFCQAGRLSVKNIMWTTRPRV